MDGLVQLSPQTPPGPDGRPIVVFKGLDNRWQMRLVSYCTDTTCPDGFDQFLENQIGLALKVAAPPTLLTIVGGWLFAAGCRKGLSRRRRAAAAGTDPV